MPKSAIIIGGSGLVGKRLVECLLKDDGISKVVSLGRRVIDADSVCPSCTTEQKAKFNSVVVDFLNLSSHRETFKDQALGFCTLGTTRADAGSAEKFKEIDYTYCLEFAKLYQEENKDKPTHFLLLTSGGSDANSFFLYPKTKGELERDCGKIGLDKLSIFRPGLLMFPEGETRPGGRITESVLQRIFPYVDWIAPSRLTAPTTVVASAMHKKALEPVVKSGTTNVEILENKAILECGISS
ncbi:hypothetical protein SmJEL517_g03164 [Synchytrium microbalum]|uniref:NAD(P)-binding domain-containing protein n=1 Tax=Synchytrium microbalum TaxID=1806994 RepID=A0A507BZ58_9FUNG|nr:uncharacterized protein SmJEL517_g03164 [Synchytrium microbalum]TPX34087.1 hypothetical protein SmJEL517_g03164 [Synchytrium microbalum]